MIGRRKRDLPAYLRCFFPFYHCIQKLATHPTQLTMSARFNKAVSIVQSLPKDGPIEPTQTQQLEFYGLYKQATLGDVTTSRPGIMDFVNRKKWDAYKKNAGKGQKDAKLAYTAKLREVLEASDSDEARQYLKELDEIEETDEEETPASA